MGKKVLAGSALGFGTAVGGRTVLEHRYLFIPGGNTVNNEAMEMVANTKPNPDETLSKEFSESNVSTAETTLLKDVGSADVSRGITEAGFVTEFNDPFAWKGTSDVGN